MIGKLKAGDRGWLFLFFALCLLVCPAYFARADWIQTPEWRYVAEDGTWVRAQWLKTEAGNWCYFNEDGYLVTDFYTFPDGKTFFFNDNGIREHGTIRVDGKVYFLGDEGELFLGDAVVDGQLCHFTEEGETTGRLTVPAKRCYSHDEHGKLIQERSVHFGNKGKEMLELPACFMLLLGLALYAGTRKRGKEPISLLLFAAVFFACTPLYLPYVLWGHDIDFHLCRLMGMKASLEQGIFPVRLDSFAFNGYGYAEMIFYPSLFLYIPAFLLYMGVPFVATVNFCYLLCSLAAAASMYYAASRLFCSKWAGCMGSILYTLSVYRLCNIYLRAAWGEMTAMIFLPLAVYGFYEIFFGDEKKWPVLTLALTGIIQSHVLSTLMVAVCCVIGGLWNLRRAFQRERLRAILKMAAVTLLLNLWFLVPLLDYMSCGLSLGELEREAEKLAIPLSKALELFPSLDGASVANTSSQAGSMPQGLGFPLIAASGLLFWQLSGAGKDRVVTEKEMGERKFSFWPRCRMEEEPRDGKKAAVLLVCGCILTFCSTSLFPWKFMMRFEWFSLFGSYIQFPWRLLGLASCALSMAGGFAVYRQWREYNLKYAAMGLLLVSLAFSQYFLDQAIRREDYRWSEAEVESMIGQKEYLPSNVNKTRAEGSLLPAGPGLEILASEKKGLEVTFSYSATVPAPEQYADLPLFYYPYYRAEDENGTALPVICSDEGLVRVLFSGTEGTIHVEFKERRLWRGCELLSAGTALLFLGGIAIQRKRQKKGWG